MRKIIEDIEMYKDNYNFPFSSFTIDNSEELLSFINEKGEDSVYSSAFKNSSLLTEYLEKEIYPEYNRIRDLLKDNLLGYDRYS